ncbi:MAG: hypothetical protein IPJ74_04305 [Saprospiraceae bacterium]|nr:hypothetical protein [Saprospiraceae bacterium]
MTKKRFKLLYFSIIITFSLAACEEQPLPDLTFQQRELADTLYLEKISVLRPQWDSICDAQFDSLVRAAVDSLILVRKEEEARLRARIQQEQQ